jgi:aryl-alcohol dehydrogenase-like predicted oxidoreductase
MNRRQSLTRRDFLRAGPAASVSLPLAAAMNAACAHRPAWGKSDGGGETGPAQLPQRRLGRAGVRVGALGLGGAWRLSKIEDKDYVERLLHEAIDSGITYFDTAHGYGRSQANLGLVMGTPRRKGLFLASKIGARTYDAAMRQFEESLKQLRVDVIDLLQVHHINPTVAIPAVSSLEQLRENVAIARSWAPMSRKERERLIVRLNP